MDGVRRTNCHGVCSLYPITLSNWTYHAYGAPEEFSSSPFRDGNGNGGGSSNPPLTRTRRSVPPAQWILNSARLLEEIFGRAYLRVFHTANGKRLELGYVFRSSP